MSCLVKSGWFLWTVGWWASQMGLSKNRRIKLAKSTNFLRENFNHDFIMGFQSSLFPDNLPNQESRLDRTNHGYEYCFEQNPSMNNTNTATGQVWLTVDIPAKYLLFCFAFVSVKGLCFGIHQACPVWESRYFEVSVLNQETSDLVVSSLSLSMFPFWDGYHPQILPRCMGNGICALCQAGSAASPAGISQLPTLATCPQNIHSEEHYQSFTMALYPQCVGWCSGDVPTFYWWLVRDSCMYWLRSSPCQIPCCSGLS